MYSWVYENLSKCAYLHVHVQLILIPKRYKKNNTCILLFKKRDSTENAKQIYRYSTGYIDLKRQLFR